MTNREQKIQDLYNAMVKARSIEGYSNPIHDGTVSKTIMMYARAAINHLHPLRRIELSNGFHAEATEEDAMIWNIYTTNPPVNGDGRCKVGELNNAAAMAWVKEMEMF